MVAEEDTHNDKRVILARKLKSHPELQGIDGESLEWAYKVWYTKSFEHVSDAHRQWGKSYAEWLKLWDWCKIDETQGIDFMSYEKSSEVELPAYAATIAAEYRSSTKRRLLAWCYVLQRDHANAAEYGTFFLTTRTAASRLGAVTKDIIAAWFKDFVRDGLLRRVCHKCGAVNKVEWVATADGASRHRQCTACGANLVRRGQRYRFITTANAAADTAAHAA